MHRFIVPAFNVALLLAASGTVCLTLRWLWLEYTLCGVAASALVLFGGAFMPKRAVFHSLTLGVHIGAFVGTVLGATVAFTGPNNIF